MTLQKLIKIAENGTAIIPWNGQKWITDGHVVRRVGARLKPRCGLLHYDLPTITAGFAEKIGPSITGWRDWTLAIRKVVRRKNGYLYRPWVVECHHPRRAGKFYLDAKYVALFPTGKRLRVHREDVGKDDPSHPIVVTVGIGKAERCIGLVMALRTHGVYLPAEAPAQ